MTRNDLLASAVGFVLVTAGFFCVLMMVKEWEKMPEQEPLCYQEWPPPTGLEARHVVSGGAGAPYVCGYETLQSNERVFQCWKMLPGCDEAR